MKDEKFTVVYSFDVREGYEDDFVKAWAALTKLLYACAGSYGSRLHRLRAGLFVAYAQWPDSATYKQAGEKLPEHAQAIRLKMRACCAQIQTTHEMHVVYDLLYDKRYDAGEA